MGQARRKKGGEEVTALALALLPIAALCIAGILINNEMTGE
jgi:hypothetical protein